MTPGRQDKEVVCEANIVCFRVCVSGISVVTLCLIIMMRQVFSLRPSPSLTSLYKMTAVSDISSMFPSFAIR